MKAANPTKGIYHTNDSAGGTITNDRVAIIFSISCPAGVDEKV